MSAVYGYLRVSGTDQVLNLQRDALAKAGCDRVWEEVASGAKNERPELLDLLDHLRAGDTLVVWRLDRLGRSLTHLIETVEDLQSRGVSFKSLTETIDTSSPGGMLIFQIFGALAQFERPSSRNAQSPASPLPARVAVSAVNRSESMQRRPASIRSPRVCGSADRERLCGPFCACQLDIGVQRRSLQTCVPAQCFDFELSGLIRLQQVCALSGVSLC